MPYVQMNVRVPVETQAAYRAMALEKSTSINHLARQALELYVGTQDASLLEMPHALMAELQRRMGDRYQEKAAFLLRWYLLNAP